MGSQMVQAHGVGSPLRDGAVFTAFLPHCGADAAMPHCGAGAAILACSAPLFDTGQRGTPSLLVTKSGTGSEAMLLGYSLCAGPHLVPPPPNKR
jgi:hypothetical protein